VIEVDKRSFTEKLIRFVSNSFFLSAILLILQIGVWLGLYFILIREENNGFYEVTRVLGFIITAAIILYVLIRCKQPSYQISWLILLALLPAFAVVMYVVLRIIPGTQQVVGKISRNEKITDLYLNDENVEENEPVLFNSRYHGLFHYLANHHFPTYFAENVTYFDEGAPVFNRMLADMEQAEHFIFLEYFIINDGILWERVKDCLVRKAAQGVEVRFIYDGFGGLRMPRDYDDQLTDAGIRCRVFSPIRPLLSSYQNNRDHRKITVIDGKIAYTGGINLADEYAGLKKRFGHWKDCGLRFEGHGVQSMTAMFLQMWASIGPDDPGDFAHYMAVQGYPHKTFQYLAPYADAPENNVDIAEDVYCQILNLSDYYVHIMTPYLILDERVNKALCFAAERGVDVKIIMPHIPDKKIVFMVGRSHYPELLAAGVQIYEYLPGFVHSKLFVCDDSISTVGSINLDFRSMFLHFENGVLMYDQVTSAEIEADFQKTLDQCMQVTPAFYRSLPAYKRLFGRVARIFGPLM
jgi:cardiolipin synthase